jgi:hypothetical protein
LSAFRQKLLTNRSIVTPQKTYIKIDFCKRSTKEVGKARAEHAKKFNYDLAAIVADIQKQQQASGRMFISLPAKRIETVALKPTTLSSNTT